MVETRKKSVMAAVEMCTAYTKKGDACRNKAKYGDYCGVHNPNKAPKKARKATKTTGPAIASTVERLILKPSQLDHFNNVESIVDQHGFYLDTSPTGAGKTIIGLKVAKSLNLPIVVVGPPTLLSKWTHEAAKYEVEVVDSLSYRALSGTKTRIDNNWLNRDDSGDDPVFSLTDYAYEKIDDGVLFIFDEVQACKNPKSATTIACVTLSQTIISSMSDSRSRVGLLSASPFDKPEHTQSIARMMNLLTERLHYYNVGSDEHSFYGYDQVVAWCRRYEPRAVERIDDFTKTGSGVAKLTRQALYELFVEIVIPRVSSTMPGLEIETDTANGFYRLPDGDAEELQALVEELQVFTKFDEKTGLTKLSSGSLGQITKTLREIEAVKVGTIVRLTTQRLENPGKVVIFLTYKDNQQALVERLESEGYPVLQLTGETTIADRADVVEAFQQSNNDYRIVVCSPGIAGEGIDLDDQDGRFPRSMFLAPSYNFIKLYQSIGRIVRVTTRSKAYIRFVYSKQVQIERPLLDSLVRKSETTKAVANRLDDMTFPSDFISEIEE